MPKVNRIKRLLERGYFPSQLPPPFNTTLLAAHSKALLAEWAAVGRPPASAQCENFSVARAGHSRRAVRIPSPVHQGQLVESVDANWGVLSKQWARSRISLSRPRFVGSVGRAITIPSLSDLVEQKLLRSCGHQWVLRTDVAQFFPSLYTHSLAWALHGKKAAKAQRNNPVLVGNILDKAVRATQHDQTIGVPIGPDTSHILAEIVGSAIDLDFKQSLGRWPAGFRYVDDYYLFFSKQSDAEFALTKLAGVLATYELKVNESKTRIFSAADLTEDSWVSQLRQYEIRAGHQHQRHDLIDFFDMVFRLAGANVDENIVKYAIRKLGGQIVRAENWDIVEAQLARCISCFPNTLQAASSLFATYFRLGYRLSKTRLESLFSGLIEDHSPLAHHSEIAWALWTCIELRLRLSIAASTAVSRLTSSICILIALDMEHKGLLKRRLSRSNLPDAFATDDLYGDRWLVAYEAPIKDWLGTTAHIAADPFFNALLRRGITFYDANAGLKPVFQFRAPENIAREPVREAVQRRNVDAVLDIADGAEEAFEFLDEEGDYVEAEQPF